MDKLYELHQEFMNEQQYHGKLSVVTLRGYDQSFRLLMEVMPELTSDRITRSTIIEFFRRLDVRTRIVGQIEKKGIKKSTVATYRSKLNQFFKWLKRHEHIEKNPFDSIEYPDVQYEDRKFIRREGIEKIMVATIVNVDWLNEYARKRNTAAMFMFLYTGIRSGELVGLKLTDIDLDRREMTIRAEISKSKIERVMPMHPKLKTALKDYLSLRRKTKFTTPQLFTSSLKDRGFTANGLKNMIEQIKKSSGVKFHPHQLRHTFAVNMLVNGTDIAKLKQLMGHRDIRMTAAYLRCLPTSAMRVDIDNLSLDNLA